MSSIYSIYNNEAIGSAVLGSFVNLRKSCTFSEAALVLPFLLHVPTVKKLKGVSNKRSLEELLTKNFDCLANFNERFYDFLPLTINSLILLSEMDIITIRNKKIINKETQVFDPDSAMKNSKRGQDILVALHELIALMENEPTSRFYSSLRIEL